MAPVRLFENDYFTVWCHNDTSIVEVVRSATKFPSPGAVGPAFAPMLLLLDDLGRHRYSLLLDSRDAVPNNDPSYEASYARYRNDLHRGFRRMAVLIRTPAGNLQATRLVPNVETPVRVFQDREQAWTFLGGPSSRPPMPLSTQRPPSDGRWK